MSIQNRSTQNRSIQNRPIPGSSAQHRRHILFSILKLSLTAVLGMSGLAGMAGSAAVGHRTGSGDDLPAGAGATILRRDCLSCHEADLIVSQRLSRAGWGRELDKMLRWGATVPAADREPLIDYLTANFAPRRAAANPETATVVSGREVFEKRCLLCHEADLSYQQRLSRVGWNREVDKMVRWGAVVEEKEREPLIEFLLSRR
jgi:cytochrome c5